MPESDKPDGLKRLWGRRQAFKLRSRQSGLFETLLPGLRVTLPEPPVPCSIDPRSFFPSGPQSISLEIGFGGGEHLIDWAKRHPEQGFIGAEPFINGMAKMLAHIDDEKIENIRLFAGDARRLVEQLVDASLARAFILFPDPWPKTRHHKRRYVQDATLSELARVIEDNGRLRIASDIPNYIEWTLERTARAPEFITLHPAGGFRDRPADWPPTRYEQKAIREGRVPVYLEFRRALRNGR